MEVIRSANQPQLGLAKSPSMMVNTVLSAGKTQNGQHKPFQRSLSVSAEAPNSGAESSSGNSDSDSDGRASEKENKNKANNKSVAAAATNPATTNTTAGARVVVPRLDDEETFEKFFASKKPLQKAVIEESVEIADFDNIKATER